MRVLCLALGLLAVWPAPVDARPSIDRTVNDYTSRLDEPQIDRLDRLIRDHHAATGVQIAVLLVESTRGEPIEDYSLAIAQAWGGGAKGQDDGVLITLAVRDRRSRIEVGYGLEPFLPDAYCAGLLGRPVPQLRAGNYGGALEVLVRGVMAPTAHLEPGGSRSASLGMRFAGGYFSAWLWALLMAILVVYFTRRAHWRARPWPYLILPVGVLALWPALGVVNLGHWMAVYGVSVLIWFGLMRWAQSKSPGVAIASIVFWCLGAVVVLLVYGNPIVVGGDRTFGAVGAHLVVLVVGLFFALMVKHAPASGGGGTTYSSGGSSSWSSSSSSSWSSSSSSSSSWSGGGGSYGGGGASGSW